MTAQSPRAPRAKTTTPPATANGSNDAMRFDALETKFECLIWLDADKQFRIINLANALAMLLAQAAQPQVQAGILSQLLSGQQPPGVVA